jgi:hypothetical protein
VPRPQLTYGGYSVASSLDSLGHAAGVAAAAAAAGQGMGLGLGYGLGSLSGGSLHGGSPSGSRWRRRRLGQQLRCMEGRAAASEPWFRGRPAGDALRCLGALLSMAAA